MKKTIRLIVLSLSMTGALALQADGVSAFASWWSPGEFDGTFGAGLQARTGGELVYFEAAGTYFDDITEEFTLIDYELSVVPLDLGLGFRFDASQDFEVYVGGGATYFVMDSNVGDTDDRVGYYFKAGCEMALSETLGLNFEAMWRDAEARVDEDEGLVDNKFQLDGAAVSLGLVFLW